MRFAGTSLYGLILICTTLPLAAESPEWLPSAIALPDPHEVVSERTIGSNNYMLTIAVADDLAGALEDWQTALQEDGFQTDATLLSEDRLLFSGPNGVEGQIAVGSATLGDGYEIRIDMSGGT